MVYVKQGIITKTLENLETTFSETICIELTISKKKWYALFAYRAPKQNQTLFFEEILTSLQIGRDIFLAANSTEFCHPF